MEEQQQQVNLLMARKLPTTSFCMSLLRFGGRRRDPLRRLRICMDRRSEAISRTGIVDEDDVVFSVQTDSDGAVGFFALPVK